MPFQMDIHSRIHNFNTDRLNRPLVSIRKNAILIRTSQRVPAPAKERWNCARQRIKNDEEQQIAGNI